MLYVLCALFTVTYLPSKALLFWTVSQQYVNFKKEMRNKYGK